MTRPNCVGIKGNDTKHDILATNKEKIFVLTNKMSLNKSGHSLKGCKSRDLTVWQFRSKKPLVHNGIMYPMKQQLYLERTSILIL